MENASKTVSGHGRAMATLAQQAPAGKRRVRAGLDTMQRVAVGFGEYRHRADTHFGTGADNAHRDFPAVGDQQLLDHAVFPRIVEQGTRVRVMITRICNEPFHPTPAGGITENE